MSTPQQIVAKINQAGGSLRVEDGELVLRVPPGTLSDNDVALLREHKATIVKVLSEEPIPLRVTTSESGIAVRCPDETTARRLEEGRQHIEATLRQIDSEITNGTTDQPASIGSQQSAGNSGRS